MQLKNKGNYQSMYTHHNGVLSGLLWASLATLLFLTESRAHASAKTGPITNCTTQQVSVNPGWSHLLTVIVVQVPISMQTEPLPLPLLNEINTQVQCIIFPLHQPSSNNFTFIPTNVTVTHTQYAKMYTQRFLSLFPGPCPAFCHCSTVCTYYFEEMKLMKFGGQNKTHIWLWGHEKSPQ